jgi:hypothetical protein
LWKQQHTMAQDTRFPNVKSCSDIGIIRWSVRQSNP